MNLFRQLKRFFSRSSHEAVALRRYEAAKADRLNAHQWTDAGDQHLNSDLTLDLDTLRSRVMIELENNPFLQGVVDTHVTDVVGSFGPTLQVISENDTFNSLLEAGWREFWKKPDLNRVYFGTDFLDLAVRNLWTQGCWLWQRVTDRTVDGPNKLRLLEVHPRRLSSPVGGADHNIILGIERNETGRPIAYYLRDALPGELSAIGALSIEPKRFSAENIIHRFPRLETSQVDGCPWLASCLQVAADLREYDAQVLEAARAAADHMVLLTTDHDDAPFFEVNESVSFQRRQIRTMPPGWKANQMKPEQPATNYVEFREERHREFGRAIGMPLMLIRLDSRKHNFASARFDAKQYVRKLRKLQGWIGYATLDELLDDVRMEHNLRAPSGGYIAEWTWPIPEFSGDPGRDAKANDIKLRNASGTLREILGERGKDFATHVEQLKREIDELGDHGIVHPALLERMNEAVETAEADDVDREALQIIAREVLDELIAERAELRSLAA